MRALLKSLSSSPMAVATAIALVLAGCSNVLKPGPTEPPTGPLASIGTDPSGSGATIVTSQDDYMPGEFVHVDGYGWKPGETVDLLMTDDPDNNPDVTESVVVGGGRDVLSALPLRSTV